MSTPRFNIITLDEAHSAKWDAFISAERMLSVSAEDTSQSLAAQVGDLINKAASLDSSQQKKPKNVSMQGLLSFQDALLLLVIGYIIAGENFPTSGSGSPFSWQEEHFLKEAIVDAIFENASLSKLKFLHSLGDELEGHLIRKKSDEMTEASPDQLENDDSNDQWGKWGDEDEDGDKNNNQQSYNKMQLKLELRDRVDNLFKFLHKLSTLKSRNVPLREAAFSLGSNFNGGSDSNKSLIYKLLTRLLSTRDVPGLEYHSSTVGRFFKSGFGRFGIGQAKPSLTDQNAMIFVIGGINGVEVLEAQEALSENGRPDIELIMGGTTLLTPDDMLDLLMGNSSYL